MPGRREIRQLVANLDQREASGASPCLIFNVTHYDSGQRFVMTTLSRVTALSDRLPPRPVHGATGSHHFPLERPSTRSPRAPIDAMC